MKLVLQRILQVIMIYKRFEHFYCYLRECKENKEVISPWKIEVIIMRFIS